MRSLFIKCRIFYKGGEKKIPNTFNTIREDFPLRGFLICPCCGGKLTASFSTGKMKVKFPYYNCAKGCKERQKAEVVNEAFVRLLQTIQPKPNTIKLYSTIVKQQLNHKSTEGKKELEFISKEMNKQKQRIENARILMLDGEIDANEFKTMRVEMEDKITKLSCELNNYNTGIRNMDAKLNISLDLFSNLSKLYVQRDVQVKRHIVSSIFPNNLIFDKSKGRTLEMNQVIAWMFSNERSSGDSRKRKHTEFGVLSPRVDPERGLSVTKTSGGCF